MEHGIRNIQVSRSIISFSRWSRKSYAVFQSLHRLIKISTLKTAVSESIIKKNISLKQLIEPRRSIQGSPDESSPGDLDAWYQQSLLLTTILLSGNQAHACDGSPGKDLIGSFSAYILFFFQFFFLAFFSALARLINIQPVFQFFFQNTNNFSFIRNGKGWKPFYHTLSG